MASLLASPAAAQEAEVGLVAVNPSVFQLRERSVWIKWDTRDAVETYEVRRDGKVLYRGPDSGAGYIDDTVSPGQTYVYVVREIGDDGTVGPASELSATPAGLNLVTSGVLPAPWPIINPTSSPGSMTLQWQDIPGTRTYDVYINGAFYASITTSYLDVPTAVGAQVQIQVRPVDRSGILGNLSRVFTFVAPAAQPTEPQVVGFRSTRQGPTSVVLTWESIPGAKYVLTRDGERIESILYSNWYTDRNLDPVTDYRYQVTPVLAEGPGAHSALLTVTTASPPLRDPGAFIANITHFGLGRWEINVKWPERPAVPLHEVFRDGQLVYFGADQGQGYHDKDITTGVEYSYTVREVGPNGERGPFGPPVSAVAGQATAPTSPIVTNTFADRSRLVLKLEPGSEASFGGIYEISVDGTIVDRVAVKRASPSWYTLKDLLPGTTVKFSVKVILADGTHSDVAALSANTTGTSSTPAKPTGLRVTRNEPRVVVLNWQRVDGAEGYQIQRNGQVVGLSTNGWFVDTTTPDTSYTYEVQALRNDFASPMSDSVSIVTPPLPNS